MPRETKGWSAERRLKQGENARKTRPWEKSTGPKTPEGKKACARNPYKHGNRSRAIREIRRILRLQREFLKSFRN